QGGDYRPLEGAADERLLLAGLRERDQGRLGVATVLLLGRDVDEVELHRVLRDAVAPEGLGDHLRTVRPARNLELDTETEGAEPLLEGRAAEVAEHGGGADRRGERQVILRLALVDVERGKEPEDIVAVIGFS